jgi:cytochrome c biogenesis protein CcmG, thiol:disulfide interchange protein DsbE
VDNLHKHMKLIILMIGLISLGLIGYSFLWNSSKTITQGINVGDRIPAFTLYEINGNKAAIGKDGKVTVINFWATWCPPCRAEFPELMKFSQANKNIVQFYSVNLQENNDKIVDFLNKEGYSLPVFLDKDGQISKMFRITAIPTTIVVDSDGIIRYRKSGAVTADELELIIKKL